MAVAERVVGAGHGGIGAVIVEQREDFGNDAVLVGADQLGGAGRDALGPLGRLAHHQHRLAERRRLFLHAARIGQHDVGTAPSARTKCG